MTTTRFQRRPWPAVAALTVVVVLVASVGAEFVLRSLGIGDPILYDSNPVYGYRPLPDRTYGRLGRKRMTFNNVGLRTTVRWSASPDRKVLFLGDSVTFGGDIVGNDEVFAHLAVRNLQGWAGGNAGVNAWGVENIHGLIVESEFLPAKVYVTVLPEGDFVRGLTRIQGLPFYNVKPATALQEIFLHFCYQQNNKRYRNWETITNENVRVTVINKAVRKLKEMDVFLKARSYTHLIFISPSRDQVLNGTAKDPMLERVLREHGVDAIYFLDRLVERRLLPSEKDRIFFDHIHLQRTGHELWSAMISTELRRVIAQ